MPRGVPGTNWRERRGPIRAASANDELSCYADPWDSWHRDLPCRPTTCAEGLCKHQTDRLGLLFVQRRRALLLIPSFATSKRHTRPVGSIGTFLVRNRPIDPGQSPVTIRGRPPSTQSDPPSSSDSNSRRLGRGAGGKTWGSNGTLWVCIPSRSIRQRIPRTKAADESQRNGDVIGACHVSGVCAAPA